MAYPKCLLAVHRDPATSPRKDTVDSRDSIAYSPTSQICLSPTSWHQLNSTGPSAEHSPVPWLAASPQRQPVWPYPPAGACLPPPHHPDCHTLGPTQCSWAPTLSLGHPLCLSGILPGRAIAAQVWRERPTSRESGGLGRSVAWAPAGF